MLTLAGNPLIMPGGGRIILKMRMRRRMPNENMKYKGRLFNILFDAEENKVWTGPIRCTGQHAALCGMFAGISVKIALR